MLLPEVYDDCVIYRFKAKPTSKVVIGNFKLNDCGDHYEIWCLCIFSGYNNKGYGTQMLTEFLAEFKHDKPVVLYVYKANTIAIRLYKKVGFVISRECSFTSDAWEMKYEVKS